MIISTKHTGIGVLDLLINKHKSATNTFYATDLFIARKNREINIHMEMVGFEAAFK